MHKIQNIIPGWIGFALLILLPALSNAQTKPAQYSYKSEMQEFERAIRKNFYDSATGFYKETVVVEENKNAYSYLWPLCGLIQAYNEIEKLEGRKGLTNGPLISIQHSFALRTV